MATYFWALLCSKRSLDGRVTNLAKVATVLIGGSDPRDHRSFLGVLINGASKYALGKLRPIICKRGNQLIGDRKSFSWLPLISLIRIVQVMFAASGISLELSVTRI